MRVVLDSNVYVSFLLSGLGPPGRLLDRLRSDPGYRLISAAEQLDELGRVLDYPHLTARIPSHRAQELLTTLPLLAEMAAELP